MAIKPRWDTDTRGRGIGSGAALRPDAERLVARLDEADWVAEDPQVHLLPHLRRALERADSPLRLVSAAADADGTYVVDLDWAGAPPDWLTRRQAAFALVGTIAETATYVRQRKADGRLELEVATGQLEGDGPFASHGHTLLLRLSEPNSPGD